MSTLKDLTALIRHQIRGDAYEHKPLRLGMVVEVDPTPFLSLTKPLIKAPPSNVVTKTTVVTLDGTSIVLHRAYFTEDDFLQMSFNGESLQDARYFALLSEIIPADAEEWRVWLDSDGLLYGKDLRWDDADATFSRHLPPVEMTERGDDLFVRISGSLFVRDNGIPEYLLACSEKRDGERSIRVYVGVDLNTASL